MRLIDADDAMRKYRELMDRLIKSTNDPNISREALSLLAGTSVISNAPTVNCPEWISVKDKLPTMRERVIAYAKSNGGGEGITIIAEMSDTNWFDQNLKTEPYWMPPFQYFSDHFEITHWMQMLEPPEDDT